jgi:probable selenium-dependent hydroxylase accessory protein YqeC
VIAFVGAGGKTTAMFHLADSVESAAVTITTTTWIRDPRFEEGRRIGRVFIESGLARDTEEPQEPFPLPTAERGAPPLVVAAGASPQERKLKGIHPQRAEELTRGCDLLLVEADGARGCSIKAPGAHEPVVAQITDVVVGLVGLDCIGAEMSPSTAHRPEILSELTGCPMGRRIKVRHVDALIRSPHGLFKGSPRKSRRIIALNKADLATDRVIEELVSLLCEDPPVADMIVVCSFVQGEIRRVVGLSKPSMSDPPERVAP